MKKVLDFFKTYWITIGIYVVLILGYKYIADTGMFGGFLFPKVDKIVSSTIQNIPTMILNMFYSFQLMIPAIAIAFSVAILVGTILGMNAKVRKVVYPVIYSISVISFSLTVFGYLQYYLGNAVRYNQRNYDD